MKIQIPKGKYKGTFTLKDMDKVKFSFKTKGYLQVIIYDEKGILMEVFTNKDTKRILTKDPLTTDGCTRCRENYSGKYNIDTISQEESIITIENCNNFMEKMKNIDDFDLNDEVKYYAGDFHTHTIYSDGKMSREENNHHSNKKGLDFFVPTDHNALHLTWPEGANVISGIELTSPFGHLNLLFTKKSPFEEYKIFDLYDKNSFLKMLFDASKYSIVSVNHPFMTPWAFLLEDYPIENIKVMEIINDPTYKTGEQSYEKALDAYNILLNNGYKITAIGGSDAHNFPYETYDTSEYPSEIGDPKTYVLSSLKTSSLQKNILKGKVAVSRDNLIEMVGYDPGDEITKSEVNLSVNTAKTFRGKKLFCHWIVNGNMVEKTGIRENFTTKLGEGYHWIRCDVRDEDNTLFGHTNPIYKDLHLSKKTIKTWGDLLSKM